MKKKIEEFENIVKALDYFIKNPELEQTNYILKRKYIEFYQNNFMTKEEYKISLKKEWINYRDIVWWICIIPCLIIYLYKISVGYFLYERYRKRLKKYEFYLRIKYEDVFNHLKNY